MVKDERLRNQKKLQTEVVGTILRNTSIHKNLILKTHPKIFPFLSQ
jgi:hypothetical protein